MEWQGLLKENINLRNMKTFFNQEEDFEVLFFGSSHMINGIFPMDLYNDYGIISYNMANHQERIISDYYQLLMSQEYNKPKLIVIDLYITAFTDTYEETEKLHDFLDAYPISYRKYLAIKNIFKDEYSLEREIESLFPFNDDNLKITKIDHLKITNLDYFRQYHM